MIYIVAKLHWNARVKGSPLFILFQICVRWQEKRGVRKSERDAGAFKAGGIGQLKPQKLGKEEGGRSMKNFGAMLPKTVWIGTLGVAAMLLVDTVVQGAEDEPGDFHEYRSRDLLPAAKPVAKKTVKLQVAAHAGQGVTGGVAGNDANARKQNAHRTVQGGHLHAGLWRRPARGLAFVRKIRQALSGVEANARRNWTCRGGPGWLASPGCGCALIGFGDDFVELGIAVERFEVGVGGYV